MENQNTNTPNGDSRKYYVDPEEAKELMAKTDKCTVIASPQEKVAPPEFEVTNKNYMSANVKEAPELNTGIRPGEQGDAIDPISAAEVNRDVTVVLDGRQEKGKEVPENEAIKASRENRELKDRAAEKYEENSGNKTAGNEESTSQR